LAKALGNETVAKIPIANCQSILAALLEDRPNDASSGKDHHAAVRL